MTRVLGIDYGTKRVGLAISDGLGLTARPLDVVPRSRLVEEVVRLTGELEIRLIVVGLPTSLLGHSGESEAGARELGEELAAATGLTVEYADERFTSRIAEESLLEAGVKRRDRREAVDKVAAAIILQGYLDARAREGNEQAG